MLTGVKVCAAPRLRYRGATRAGCTHLYTRSRSAATNHIRSRGAVASRHGVGGGREQFWITKNRRSDCRVLGHSATVTTARPVHGVVVGGEVTAPVSGCAVHPPSAGGTCRTLLTWQRCQRGQRCHQCCWQPRWRWRWQQQGRRQRRRAQHWWAHRQWRTVRGGRSCQWRPPW